MRRRMSWSGPRREAAEHFQRRGPQTHEAERQPLRLDPNDLRLNQDAWSSAYVQSDPYAFTSDE
jgi:hypothetical protein